MQPVKELVITLKFTRLSPTRHLVEAHLILAEAHLRFLPYYPAIEL
jgi:hypothetical protein